MTWAYRDNENKIVGWSKWQNDPGQDFVAEDDPELLAFLGQDDAGIKATVWEQIKAERDRRKAGGVLVNVAGVDKWFHTDADSRIQQLGLKDKARDMLTAGGIVADNIVVLGQSVQWKTMDGSFVPLTVQLVFDIFSAVGDLEAQLFANAEAHRAAMEASGDPGSYDFSGGWPLMFGE